MRGDPTGPVRVCRSLVVASGIHCAAHSFRGVPNQGGEMAHLFSIHATMALEVVVLPFVVPDRGRARGSRPIALHAPRLNIDMAAYQL